MKIKMPRAGFTLIEMLIVIVIIGILAAALIPRLQSIQGRARDTKRKADLYQLTNAISVRHADYGTYPVSAGWFTNAGHGGLDTALVAGGYIVSIPDDPLNNNGHVYQYRRKDYPIATGCAVSDQRFSFNAKLENIGAADTGTVVDSFDVCVRTYYGLNYKYGN